MEIHLPQSQFRRSLNSIMKKFENGTLDVVFISVKGVKKYTAVSHERYQELSNKLSSLEHELLK